MRPGHNGHEPAHGLRHKPRRLPRPPVQDTDPDQDAPARQESLRRGRIPRDAWIAGRRRCRRHRRHDRAVLRAKDPAVAKKRGAIVQATLAKVFDAAASGPRPLTHRDLARLSGEVYRLVIERFGENPGTPDAYVAWIVASRSAVLANSPRCRRRRVRIATQPSTRACPREGGGEPSSRSGVTCRRRRECFTSTAEPGFCGSRPCRARDARRGRPALRLQPGPGRRGTPDCGARITAPAFASSAANSTGAARATARLRGFSS
jgi:hypothetical protein